MLGRLIQGYSRGSQLESATDETHTRNLLWPEFHSDGRHGSFSPPATPFGSPTLRVSPFDDRVGLELNESKDLRLIIAQDAFGTNDRPLLLFDSQAAEPSSSPSESAAHDRSSTSPTAFGQGKEQGFPIIGHMRNRSSTMSGASAPWARLNKDSEATDHISNILDCMFGVSSATKSGSSTKMHLLPGDRSAPNDLGLRTSSSSAAPARAPLLRARTSTHGVNNHRHQFVAPKEAEVDPRDAILITRMFPVTLPEAQESFRHRQSSTTGQDDPASPIQHTQEYPEAQGSQGKRPKLVEKKTPVYAIGLLCYLPRSSDARPNTTATRPPSRASFNAASTPNSYGSDSFSSWTFLNAIPEHLLSPEASEHLTDKGIGIIVKNWDVILRSLAVIELGARAEIGALLQEVNLAMISPAAKAPKGPSEQRTNQRNVYLRSADILVQSARLQQTIKHALRRVSYALRVPRVLTGFGLENGGHWLDEARYLVRLYGNKQQNFFLFNLLTAFLGNHTEWLERLGPDWYRKQFKALNKGRSPPSNLASRTVIICDNRSTARRLIFLLASFLPPSHGANGLAKLGAGYTSPLLTPGISSPSSIGRIAHEASMRRHFHSKSRESPMTFPRREVLGLSTSVSSTDSFGDIGKGFWGGSRSAFSRSDLEPGPSRQASMFSPSDGAGKVRKTNAINSAATSDPVTPAPHFSTQVDSYFPEGAVVDGEEGGASADLARILRRDSISHPPPSQPGLNWGSLISNVSGLWGKKQESSSSANEAAGSSTAGSLRDRRRAAPGFVPLDGTRPSPLERMVDEAGDLRKTVMEGHAAGSMTVPRQSVATSEAQPPRLRVDDKDGVVDVDINIPGFVGLAEGRFFSPPSSQRHRSPSFASTDGEESCFSAKSYRADASGTNPMNVAGYLKRYHEDFILQGVKPYQELQDEIRQSMSRETTPVDDPRSPVGEEQNNGELWVNVCTTLLADCRNFTIQRLTLRRRANSEFQDRQVTPDAPLQPGAISNQTGISRMQNAPGFPFNPTEHFVSETVMDFDTTLTDAIERVLGEAEQPRRKPIGLSTPHSRAVSTSTAASVRSEPLEISGSGKMRGWPRSSIHAQSDCRHAVVGALEEVVKSVNDDLAKHQRSKEVDGSLKIDGKALEQDMKQDNILREGVKKWLLNVETRSVW